MSHYALVSRSRPLTFETDEALTEDHDTRGELTKIFQHYADLYPNPKLAEESRLRDTLLQAVSAATNAKNQNKRPKTKGFFSRLFGGSDGTKEEPMEVNVAADTEEDPLVYTEQETGNEDGLCGTMQSLDMSCIPEEAYSVARFQMTSSRTRQEQPNAVRGGPCHDDSSRFLVLVGLGMVAEFQADGTSNVLPTSDREELNNYASVNTFHLSHARAASVGPDCIAVSWGFPDGIVVFYRRIAFPDFHGWEQVWMLGPSRAVLDAMTDIFQDEDQLGSPLLRVSDMLPLLVESPALAEQAGPPMVATLAIARIGGFLDLVPLPTALWYGPELNPGNYQRPRRKSKRKRGQHYAEGKNVVSQDHTVALTTREYHIDIQCMDAFRTPVTGDTEWDMQAFPDTPPAEFVLAISGTSKHKHETITFWAISTLFADDHGTRSKKNDNHGMEFRLHAALIEALTATSGADVTIFATPEIMKRWRAPRHIELRRDISLGDSTREETNGDWQRFTNKPSARISTISTAAPMVAMRFSMHGNLADPHASLFLALLDWNGSVTILDCSFMRRVASQSLTPQEYEQYRSSKNYMPFPLANIILNRSQFASILKNRSSRNLMEVSVVANIHWLAVAAPQCTGALPPLVVMLGKKTMMLNIITFFLHEGEQEGGLSSSNSTSTSLAFPGHGASIRNYGNEDLLFVSLRKSKKRKRSNLEFFAMQRLQPQAIIQSLASAAKYEEAIQAACKLPETDRESLDGIVEECQRKLWEKKRDVDSLAQLRDARYVVQEAVSLCRAVHDISLADLRQVCSLALVRGKNYPQEQESLEEILHFLIKLATFELLCRHFLVDPSLRQFQEEFSAHPLKELALQFALAGEISALSILFFRHRSKLIGDLFSILDKIPLAMDPAAFCHLLPVERDGSFSDFFLSKNTNDRPMHWSGMPQYLNEIEGTVIVLDSKDEKMVLEYNKRSHDHGSREAGVSASISDWIAARAVRMQTFLGKVQPVIILCEFGLLCSHPALLQTDVPSAPAAVQRLYRTWRSACSLQQMLIDGVVSLEGRSASTANQIAINTETLLKMEPVEIVSLVLRDEADRAEISARCAKYLKPLINSVPLPCLSISRLDGHRRVEGNKR